MHLNNISNDFGFVLNFTQMIYMISNFKSTMNFIKFISVKKLLRGITFDVKLIGVNGS
jgi:hypothetical protein